MNVTLKHIRAFLAVADEGGFRSAAARLHMGQPALSLLIRSMELDLGITLFDRTTRRVTITAAGNELRGRLEKLVGDLDIALRETREIGDRRRGRVAICAPPLLAAVLMPRAIAAFRVRYPGIEVVLMEARTDQMVEKVRGGQADLGVGTFAGDEPDLMRTTIAQDRLLLFCPRGSDLARRARVAWTDLDGRDLITLTRESGIRLLVELGLHAHGRHARPAFEVSQVTTALALVEASLGVAVLPTLAWSFARDRAVTARPLGPPEITRDVSLIQPLGRALCPAAQALRVVLTDRATVADLTRCPSGRSHARERQAQPKAAGRKGKTIGV